jgi:predicted outer membrane repeat protein
MKVISTLLVSMTLVLLFPFAVVGQNEIYVVPDGAGIGTINDPIDLQGGLDLAVSNGFEDILYLASGTYLNVPYLMNVNTGDGLDIEISGGWNTVFTEQTENPSLTVIDGQSGNRCFEINAEGIPVDIEVTLNYLTFANGFIDGHGAGIYVNSASPVTANTHLSANRCDFINNATDGNFSGGGIYTKTSFSILECLFENNVASNGGAILATYGEVTPDALRSIEGSVFIGNQNYGNQGSTIYTACPNSLITKSIFNGMPDGSSNGPGSCVYDSTGGFATIDRCEFSGLRIDYWGSALQSWDSGFKVSNSLFANNSCGEFSGYGAVTFYHNNGPDRYHEITNCTFVGNTSGNGFYADVHYRGNGADELHIYNSIFWGNLQTSLYTESGTADIANSISMSAPLNFTEITPTSGVDPLLTSGFGLEAGSPAVDAGNNEYVELTSFDLFGSPRVLGGTVDVGCDEFNAAPDDIELSAMMIDENVPANTEFSVATAIDQAGDFHTFEMAAGDGSNDADNDLFYFTDEQLRVTLSPNYEAQNSYAIYVRAVDSDNQVVEKAFEIMVNDLNDAPVFVQELDDQTGIVGEPNTFSIDPAVVEDEDVDDELTYTAELSDGNDLPAWLNFDSGTLTFSGTPVEAEVFEIKLIVTDEGGLSDEAMFFYEINTVGLVENDAVDLEVFPNPTTDVLQIETECNGTVNYWINDLSGRSIFSGSVPCKLSVIDVSSLQSGAYVIVLDAGDGFQSARFVKR